MTEHMRKVRAGFYRCGAYCIHWGRGHWGLYHGPKYILSFSTLKAAREWAAENQP